MCSTLTFNDSEKNKSCYLSTVWFEHFIAEMCLASLQCLQYIHGYIYLTDKLNIVLSGMGRLSNYGLSGSRETWKWRCNYRETWSLEMTL